MRVVAPMKIQFRQWQQLCDLSGAVTYSVLWDTVPRTSELWTVDVWLAGS
mgnify:CR=1 FL=1